LFAVSPSDGIVASTAEPDSVEKTDNNYYFIPSKVKTFRKPISFTVNGQQPEVECSITVYEHPNATFSEDHQLKENILYVTIINTTTPTDLPGQKYDWIFNDGTSKTGITNTLPFQEKFNIDDLQKLGLTDLVIKTNRKIRLLHRFSYKNYSFKDLSPQISCPNYVKTTIEKDLKPFRQ
jgi:hypothetical protein